jgi:hypothetical protein
LLYAWFVKRSDSPPGKDLRKALALVKAYENLPTEGKKWAPFPTKKALHLADLVTTGGAGQIIADRLHGKKVDLVQAGMLAGGTRMKGLKMAGAQKLINTRKWLSPPLEKDYKEMAPMVRVPRPPRARPQTLSEALGGRKNRR